MNTKMSLLNFPLAPRGTLLLFCSDNAKDIKIILVENGDTPHMCIYSITKAYVDRRGHRSARPSTYLVSPVSIFDDMLPFH